MLILRKLFNSDITSPSDISHTYQQSYKASHFQKIRELIHLFCGLINQLLQFKDIRKDERPYSLLIQNTAHPSLASPVLAYKGSPLSFLDVVQMIHK